MPGERAKITGESKGVMYRNKCAENVTPGFTKATVRPDDSRSQAPKGSLLVGAFHQEIL